MSKRPSLLTTSILLLFLLMPNLALTQTPESEIDALQRKVDELSKMLTQLQAEQNQSDKVVNELEQTPRRNTKSNKQRTKELQRKQAESRLRIDAITQEIIELSQQLEDPRKRFALAKRMQEQAGSRQPHPEASKTDSSATLETISARSIDLNAVKLVRDGKSLDQARLLTIDNLTSAQVLSFYRDLSKEDRYELYDIADEIVETEALSLNDARRSAIYFFLFAK